MLCSRVRVNHGGNLSHNDSNENACSVLSAVNARINRLFSNVHIPFFTIFTASFPRRVAGEVIEENACTAGDAGNSTVRLHVKGESTSASAASRQ